MCRMKHRGVVFAGPPPVQAAGRRLAVRRRRSPGQALLEASILTPLLLFLFLGVTNFGFFVYNFMRVI